MITPGPEAAEVARAESERGEIVLRAHREDGGPDVLELRVNGVFVMDTQETSSERALAEVALAQVPDPRNVLIGGLGLGFTLQQVLADTRVERAVVVEIEESLVEWMRDGTIPHGPALLADQRVTIANLDIVLAIDEARESSYDLVLLDVDNGPDNLVHQANSAIYRTGFLKRIRRLIAPGGVVVIWSAAESEELDAALREVFEHSSALSYDVDLQGRAETYWLHLGS